MKIGFQDKDFRNEDLRISGLRGFNSSGMTCVAGGRRSAVFGTGGRRSAVFYFGNEDFNRSGMNRIKRI